MGETSGEPCPVCGVPCPPEMSFCGSCGSRLRSSCARCGFDNPPQFRFCGRCGGALDGGAAPSEPSRVAKAAERRQLTVMFSDLVGSTRLSEELDPEELREVILEYQSACGRIVEGLDGHIAQYLGDGVLVYFGYPVAHEDDARRAVRAGLEIVSAVGDMKTHLALDRGLEIGVRVGIHSGEVVTGEVGGGELREHLALGSTPNLAARLQEGAEPGTVVLSEATRRLLRGFADCRPIGRRTFKGVSRPIEVFQALGLSDPRSRLEVAPPAPAVGRQIELAVLEETLERVRGGKGQVVLIEGEAGIGKSRLLSAFRQGAAGDLRWLVAEGSAIYRNTAFQPVKTLLSLMLGLGEGEPPEESAAKLARGLEGSALDPGEGVPLLANLLGLPLAAGYEPLDFSPKRQKIKVLDGLVTLLLGAAATEPLVVVLEDLHWFDPSSLELLDMLGAEAGRARLLLLVTARPDGTEAWRPRRFTKIELLRLQPHEVLAMIETLTGAKPLPPALVEQIVDRTDGVPLFVEELTKSILESEILREERSRFEIAGPLGDDAGSRLTGTLAIPTTLRDSLMARLDRLGEAKQVAQLCSVLGRAFTYPRLAAVSRFPEDLLRAQLERLVEAEMLFQEGAIPQATFNFRHALVQDAAHASLLKSERRQLHERAATALREQFPDLAESKPELVAQHYDEASQADEAIEFYDLAGQRALAAAALVEATRHYERALQLLLAQPDSAARGARELGLRSLLGVALLATKGYAAREVEHNYTRAEELCALLGDIPFGVRYGIWAVRLMRGHRAATETLAQWFLDYLKNPEDPTSELMAHASLGVWAFWRGYYPLAREHLEATKKRFDPDQHQAVVRQYGGSGGFYGHTVTSWWLLLAGYPDQARRHHREVLEISERLGDPFTRTEALTHEIVHAQFFQEVERVAAAADQVVELAGEHGFVWLQSIGLLGQGWVMARAGRTQDGVALMEQGLEAFRATGTVVLVPYYSSYLVEVLLAAGMARRGLRLADEALAMSRENVDSFYTPELLRLRGELELLLERPEQAEVDLRSAVEEARSQGARSLELRAATSLGRLLRERGDEDAARLVVGEALAPFSEGFDTADLRRARELAGEG